MRRWGFVLPLVVAVAACGEGSTWVSPGPVPPHPLVIAGTVYEHTPTGVRPLAGVPLNVGQDGIGSDTPNTVSNTEGRYRAEFPGNLSPEFRVWAVLPGYQQPCRAATDLKKDLENVLDVHLVPDSIVSASGIPHSIPITEPSVYGQIVERTAEGDVPVQGALVSGEFNRNYIDDVWSVDATTLSDASGRYLLCGAVDRASLIVTARGYTLARAPLNLRLTRSYDFVLIRGTH